MTDRTHLEALARAHALTALKTLAEIMNNPNASARDRRAAAASLRRFLRRFPYGDPAEFPSGRG